MELTKEHFDQALNQAISGAEKRIIKRIDEAQEELARMVSAGFEDTQERLNSSERLEHLEHWARQTSQKVGIEFDR